MRWFRWRGEDDFADEVRAHIDLEADRLIAQGASPDEAHAAARRAFGNVTVASERFRESQRGLWLDSLHRNLRYAIRGLLRRRAFTATAVLTLAFGIGVNAALFTLLYSLLLRPLPVGEPGRVVNVSRQVREDGRAYQLVVQGSASLLSYPDYVNMRDGSRALEQLAIYRRQELTLAAGDRVVGVHGQLASCNYFTTARLPVILGRGFAPDECAHPGDGRVVILSHGFWRRQFGGDSSVVGRAIDLNRLPLTVIGVAAEGFAGIDFEASEAWVPITLYPALYPARAGDLNRDMSWLAGFGRLRDGANVNDARADLTALAKREDQLFPGRASTIVVSRGTRLSE
ncbi:MAG: ABC transporter permease, partial [Gemmatimonadaceae bacterium]